VIAVCVPGGDFCLEGWEVSDAAIKALFGEGSPFNFRHIQPRAMFWRVMEFKTIKKFSGDFRPESFRIGRLVCGCSDCQQQFSF